MDILEQLEAEGYKREQVKAAFEISLQTIPFEAKLSDLRQRFFIPTEHAEELLLQVTKHQRAILAYYNNPTQKEKGEGARFFGRVIAVISALYAISRITQGKANILDFAFVLFGVGLLIYTLVNKKL